MGRELDPEIRDAIRMLQVDGWQLVRTQPEHGGALVLRLQGVRAPQQLGNLHPAHAVEALRAHAQHAAAARG